MRELRKGFLVQVAQWDQPTKTALSVTLGLLVVMFAIYGLGGESLRAPAVIGIATLFVMAQGIVLWGNRRMVTPFTEAQRLYMNGNLESARQLLETQRKAHDTDMQELTLLGNIYRQLGDLQTSEAVLYEALNISPAHHFPLYGLGRTKLCNGEYDAAAQLLQQALDAGAPINTQSELLESLYLGQQTEQAASMLPTLLAMQLEDHRYGVAAFVAYQLTNAERPSASALKAVMDYWSHMAARFSDTSYGLALAKQIEMLKSLQTGD